MSKKRNQRIVHPIFQSMHDNEVDPFWKNEFIRALHGNFPQKVIFRNNILTFTKNNKKEVIKLNSKNDVFENIKSYREFITKNVHLKSRIEFKRDELRNIEIEAKIKSIDDYRWEEIKKKKIKEVLIWNYINKLEDEYKLNQEEKYDLFITIQTNLILKKINKFTIEYEEGEIKNISNLIFDKDGREFTVSGNYSKKKDTSITDFSLLNLYNINNSVSFLDRWKKYIDIHINRNESVYNTTAIDESSTL